MLKFGKQYVGKLSWAMVVFSITLFSFPIVYADVGLNLKHNVDRNTYVKGQQIIVNLEHTRAAQNNIRYHWQNYKGEKLTQPKHLDSGIETIIHAPVGPLPRYLGLVFTPVSNAVALPGREPGEAKEFGFAVFPDVPPEKGKADPKHWMGMVHADLEDPWLLGWVKTVTWKTTSAKWWHSKMEKRRSAGSVELPIITGSEWKSDDYKAIADDQLKRLYKKVRDYLAADRATLYWETGIEENLGGRFERPFYFKNLAAKSDVIRTAANEVNPDIKLIFQVANMHYEDVGSFMRSDASKNYDVLALHPYKWPNFPPPEKWLKNFLSEASAQMKASGRELPIWVTEIGAPHRGNCPTCFFGYPKDNNSVPGLSNQEMISYMIKFHVIAAQYGVKKVFWYNYKDRGSEREFAEDHFGLIDYWGYPKPAYLAYINLNQSLVDKVFTNVLRKNDIWAYEFDGDIEKVTVAWSFPAPLTKVTLEELGISALSDADIRVTNALGDPLKLEQNQVVLGQEPIFIHTSLIRSE